jgi:hypothetical protein
MRPASNAMFNLAIDSTFRECDMVHLKAEDIAPHGITADWVCVRISGRHGRHGPLAMLNEDPAPAGFFGPRAVS